MDEREIEELICGSVVFVPNSMWGFEVVESDDHPGICVFCSLAKNAVTLVKGSDFDKWRGLPASIVHPTDQNGLCKSTAFRYVPYVWRVRRIELLLESPRYAGRIRHAELVEIRDGLKRSFRGARRG